MDLSPRPFRCEGRSVSMESDYGLSSSTSTIDPNDSLYSDCSSCLSLDSSFEDDVFVQSLIMRSESFLSLNEAICESQAADVLSFSNTSALCHDMKFVDGIPEICDIKFLVGKDKVPVFAVRAIISARSRVLCSMILAKERQIKREKAASKKRKRGIIRLLRRKLKTKENGSKSESTVNDQPVLTIDIPDFAPDVFRRVLLFLHSGTISIDLSNVIGVMNAAEVYGLDDLRSASFQFARRFINLQAVLPLVEMTEPYREYSLTQKLLQEVFEFVEKSAEKIVNQLEFTNLSKSSAILILSQKELRMSEESKWDAALEWCRRNSNEELAVLQSSIKSFTPSINLLQIPLSKLISQVTPLCSGQLHFTQEGVTSYADTSVLTQIAFDPESFFRKSSVSSACSKFSLASYSTDSGYTSSYRESCLL